MTGSWEDHRDRGDDGARQLDSDWVSRAHETAIPRHAWPDGIPATLREDVRRWCRRWGDESLAHTTPVFISTKMRRTLGCATRTRPLVRVHAALVAPECHALLREVLCHEFAHLFVFASVGRNARPHGREWRALMLSEGFAPRATIPWSELPPAISDLTVRPRRRRTVGRRRGALGIGRFASSLLALFA